jgi:hypothetical protein
VARVVDGGSAKIRSCCHWEALLDSFSIEPAAWGKRGAQIRRQPQWHVDGKVRDVSRGCPMVVIYDSKDL